ncbi:hypothetical protein R5R67_18835 [Acinetobacter sp. OYA S30]|uniref:hypothetical protein n=1 Tax=Acinetobacter sp. OYA S30 TaxID=3084921 RepID=UPI00298F039E|nr:hypothetical protein [Acinetobacter sp. OYA S30]MDW8490728.1 hypothetical protein [Acinetobacter sp. OYA S30]
MKKGQFVYDTCALFLEHIKNSNLYNKYRNDGEIKGVHSRLLERLFHPEEHFYLKGYSKKYLEMKEKDINHKGYKEHIVPMSFLTWELIELLDSNISDDEIINILKRCLGVVYITEQEASHMDFDLKLKNKMPDGWDLVSGDPYDRLHIANIEIVDFYE